jgi:pyridoxine 5-phosphate synthase
MPHLCVNIDHVATLRQVRREKYPDPVLAAALAERAGAIGITVHLREDRRHIQDADVLRLRKTVKGKLNLEMAASPEIIKFALKLGPDECTLVPEKRQELTTEGGLDVAGQKAKIARAVWLLREAGIVVSLFIGHQASQVGAAAAVGADFIELHTGGYANAFEKGGAKAAAKELKALKAAAALASRLGLGLNAGHGLTYQNVRPIAKLPGLQDLNIGHNIVARAVLVGMEQAVREMAACMAGKAQ